MTGWERTACPDAPSNPPRALDQHVSSGGPLGRVRKAGHQLKGWKAGDKAIDIILPLLNGVGEKDLQQGQVQTEQHVQNTIAHQYPDNVGMDQSRGNVGVVEELLEK